ncbi:MAG: hypothetical protein ACXWTP_00230 [Methylosarcina sp.]
MFVQLVEKQQRAVAVVRAALLGVGITDRQVSAGYDSWTHPSGHAENFAVFVGAPAGTDIEPFYESGKSFVEAVKKMLASIKGRANAAKSDDQSEVAPF